MSLFIVYIYYENQHTSPQPGTTIFQIKQLEIKFVKVLLHLYY